MLLMFLVSVKYIFQIPLPSAVVMGLLCLMICLGDLSQIVAVCVMCLPLTEAITHDYVLLFAMAVLAVRYTKQIRVDLSIAPVLLMILWELLHNLSGIFSVRQLTVTFIPLLLCAMLMWMDAARIDYALVVRRFAVCTCVMCLTLVGMVLVRADFDLVAAFSGMQRLGLQEENAPAVSVSINPNSVGILCVLAVSGLLQMIAQGRRRPTDPLLIVLILICGALTLSRTYLVLLVLMAVLFVFAQRKGMKRKLKTLAAMFGAAAAAVIVLQLAMPFVVEKFISRFQSSDITSGRTGLLQQYNAYILSGPEVLFWGIGLTDFSQRVVAATDLFNVPHNGIQELVIAWGLPGLCMMGLFGLSMCLRARKTAKRLRLMNWIPLILLVVKIQAGQMLTSGYTMLAFTLAYLSLAQDFSGRSEAN